MRSLTAALGLVTTCAVAAPAAADEPDARGTTKASNAAPHPGERPSERLPPQPETPARTPLPPAPPGKTVPWERTLEVGGDFAFAQKAASHTGDGAETGVRYQPAVGFGLHARWYLFKYLRFAAYFVDADHEVDVPPGSLEQPSGSILTIDSVHTFSFGARVSPTLPLGDRARAWLSAGIGWGRLEFGRMQVEEPDGSTFEVRERADPFLEFPLGVGASFDVIPRWLSLEVELVGAFVDDQQGEALGSAQAIDAAGRKRRIGGFPSIDGTFLQTVGLSLIL